MQNKLSQRKKLYLLLLSILAHLALLYILFFTQIHEMNDAHLLEKLFEQPQKEREQWASTKAQASNFGATVLFQDRPAFAKATADRPEFAENIKPLHKASVDTVASRPAMQQTNQPEPPKPKNIPEEKIEEQLKKKETPEPKKIEKKESELETRLAQKEEKIPEKKNQLIEKKEKARPEPTLQKQPKTEQTKNNNRPMSPGFGQKDANPMRKQITMADIAKGFLHQIKNEGPHHVTMIGDDNGKVTQEQLKYERYIQKILWCIQNSERINRHRLDMQKSVNTKLLIHLTLARNGKPINIKLVEPSGFSELDEFYLFIFKDASSAFPPIPNYLKDDPFRFGIQVNIEMEANRIPFRFSIS